jgi:hypothetical protein
MEKLLWSAAMPIHDPMTRKTSHFIEIVEGVDEAEAKERCKELGLVFMGLYGATGTTLPETDE